VTTSVLDALVAEWAAAAAPPPTLCVSEWADAKRVLPETSGARGGRWRTATTPYLRGIMDAVHEIGVRMIAVRKAAQLGGSEALLNLLGYFVEFDPCPMLFVHPTMGDAEEWSKERLAPMILSTPALRAVVRDKRQPRGSHTGESTLALKMFPGGYLALGGANTPNTFARRAVKVAIGDDVDRWPPVVGDEGDPADLLRNRTRTFYDALVILVSTPTLKGGRIDTLYERSDQRQYVVTCPSCGRRDWITWNAPTHFRVIFEEHDPHTARLACADDQYGGCGARHDEPTRRAMIDGGTWQATAERQETGLAGFHVPEMISTLGTSLESMVDKWLSARARGRESLRVFVNTSLAEGWEDRTARAEPQLLLSRRESYGEDVDVPAGGILLAAGVDVQKDRFDLQVIAWGFAGERWVVDWRSIPGDPKQPETRAALLETLGQRYRHASGQQLPIHVTCIDSGYATEEVYDFVLANQVRRIYATKGIAGRSGEPIVGKASEKRYGKSPRPVRLYPVNVDDAKADIMAATAQITPGPNCMHFGAFLDEEYFAQLCAEHREPRYNKGHVATHWVWVKDRDRNEALDTAVLCLAGYRLYDRQIRHMAEVLAATPVEGAAPPPQAGPAAAQPAAPQPARTRERRFSRSSYLG